MKAHSQEPAVDQLGALLRAAVDAIILIDRSGIVTQFNAAAERIFGYSREEVIGRNVSMLMPNPYRDEHDRYLERYQQTGQAHIIGIGREVIAGRKDGTVFPIELSVGEFFDGVNSGYVGIIRDITQRKQQEEQLRQSSEELRLIFDNAPTAMTITDLEGQVLNVNRSACELLRYEPEELLRLRLVDLVHEEDRAELERQFGRLREGEETCQCEVRYVSPTAEVVHAVHHAAVVHDENGEPLMLISEIVDRSALYEANREAEELQRQLAHVGRIGTLGEMVSGIAHEVNQPLAAIASYASACRRMMLANQTNPGETLSILEKIARQAERAGQVIRGLRSLAKRSERQRQAIEPNQLVRDVIRLVEFELRGDGFQLELSLEPELPLFMGDGVQIQQVILNLIRNAIEAMADSGEGDTVSIETLVPEADWIEVRVSDRGPGLPVEVAQRLFEPFFTTKPQGMGLGLSICKSIASAHGGELSYFVNEHHGATFALRLPACDSSEETIEGDGA